jgi:hypothetical protein
MTSPPPLLLSPCLFVSFLPPLLLHSPSFTQLLPNQPAILGNSGNTFIWQFLPYIEDSDDANPGHPTRIVHTQPTYPDSILYGFYLQVSVVRLLTTHLLSNESPLSISTLPHSSVSDMSCNHWLRSCLFSATFPHHTICCSMWGRGHLFPWI